MRLGRIQDPTQPSLHNLAPQHALCSHLNTNQSKGFIFTHKSFNFSKQFKHLPLCKHRAAPRAIHAQHSIQIQEFSGFVLYFEAFSSSHQDGQQ